MPSSLKKLFSSLVSSLREFGDDIDIVFHTQLSEHYPVYLFLAGIIATGGVDHAASDTNNLRVSAWNGKDGANSSFMDTQGRLVIDPVRKGWHIEIPGVAIKELKNSSDMRVIWVAGNPLYTKEGMPVTGAVNYTIRYNLTERDAFRIKHLQGPGYGIIKHYLTTTRDDFWDNGAIMQDPYIHKFLSRNAKEIVSGKTVLEMRDKKEIANELTLRLGKNLREAGLDGIVEVSLTANFSAQGLWVIYIDPDKTDKKHGEVEMLPSANAPLFK